MLGILGGMGPLATADFFTKLIAETPADREEDHVPVLLLSDPRIPPRPPAILQRAESPLPVLRLLRDRLVAAVDEFLTTRSDFAFEPGRNPVLWKRRAG